MKETQQILIFLGIIGILSFLLGYNIYIKHHETSEQIKKHEYPLLSGRTSVSICRFTKRFIDKTTYFKPNYNVQDCQNIGYGARNQETQTLISAQHIFSNPKDKYFLNMRGFITPIQKITFHPKYDLARSGNGHITVPKQTEYTTKRIIYTQVLNNTLTGIILSSENEKIVHTISLGPGSSGLPLRINSGSHAQVYNMTLFAVNVSQNILDKKKYYAIPVLRYPSQ